MKKREAPGPRTAGGPALHPKGRGVGQPSSRGRPRGRAGRRLWAGLDPTPAAPPPVSVPLTRSLSSPFLSELALRKEKPALDRSEHLQGSLLLPQGSAHGGSHDLVSLQRPERMQEPREQG